MFSLGDFDEKGYQFNGENSCLKVTKDVLVVLKGQKVGNIYKLVGETSSGEAIVASDVEMNLISN